MNNIIQTIRHTARAATVLLIALLTAQTAGAQMTVTDVSGLVAAFGPQGVSVVNVTNDITDVGDLNLSHDLTINLNGHTISGDELSFNINGCKLTINGGGSVGNIISGYADVPAINNGAGTVTLSHVNITTNYSHAIYGAGTLNIGDNVSSNGWTEMPFNTEDVNTESGNYNYDRENPFANVVATVTVGVTPHYFENSGAALAYINSHPDNDHFSLSGTTYTIHTATGWDAFCYLLANSDKGFFTGKTVQLGADIGTADDPVTGMAGASGKDFTGTFDGQGNTLTVNYANTDNNTMTAPFSYVDGATIQNLIVGGTISGTAYRAAGIIGETGNTTSHITNCVSSVTISGDRYTGGFSIGGNVEIEGCVFNGKINGTDRSGGFIGHSNSAQVIKNSLFAPKDGSSISGGTFYYNGGGDVAPVNSYYTLALGTAQGKALHSVTAGDDVTLALSGTATHYTVSGITAYEGNQGIKYGTTYYAGSGDAVRLTLSNTATGAPEGYSYGYTVSAGTLSGSTLTMPEEDVAVSVNTAVLTAIPWDGDGTEGSPYIIKYASQLDLLAYRVNGTHGETCQTDGYENTYFQLANDISYPHTSAWNDFDSDENNYEAIGGGYNGNWCIFCGHFDGNNKTISGIRIYKNGKGSADNYQGIFGQADADIHDLTLADARITGCSFTGGIVSRNYGTVSRCHVADNVAACAVQSEAWYHGGIAGVNDGGTIEQCTSAATLTTADATSTQYYGGIVGRNYNGGTLRDNLAIGATVPATANNSYGAITGYNDDDGTLQRNYYAACKVANTPNATGVGCEAADVNNEDNPDGAVCINTLDLAAREAPDDNYWTTYYNGALGFTIDADENACAYTATYGDGKLTLHKLGKEIPKNTAVIIVAENNVVSMTATTALDDFSGTNDLRGVNVDTPVADIRSDLGTGTFYVLGMTTVDNEQHFGFHRYTGSTMAAHKAFVFVGSSPEALARSLTMVFDDATGIVSAEANSSLFTLHSSLSTWFTLDGRRLQAKPTAPGIYINNGKKVVIK